MPCRTVPYRNRFATPHKERRLGLSLKEGLTGRVGEVKNLGNGVETPKEKIEKESGEGRAGNKSQMEMDEMDEMEVGSHSGSPENRWIELRVWRPLRQPVLALPRKLGKR